MFKVGDLVQYSENGSVLTGLYGVVYQVAHLQAPYDVTFWRYNQTHHVKGIYEHCLRSVSEEEWKAQQVLNA